MGLSTLVINVAYVSLFASTFTRTVAKLRSFLIAAALCFIAFGTLDGNWSMVAWNVLTGAMNARQLIVHARRRRSMMLSDDDELVRERWFADLDRFDFATLWSMGEDVVRVDERLIEVGEDNVCTWLVVDGVVDVDPGDSRFQLGPGSLVGEMSLVSGGVATADVDAVGRVRLRQWSHQRLQALDELNPRAGRGFHRFLERQLTAKALR